jgi:hypothetical protein
MPSVSRRGLLAALVVAAVVCALLAQGSRLGVDYFSAPCHGYVCDDPAASIDALASGKVHDFFANQPPMGGFSLVLRTPFVAVGNALGVHRELPLYRLGAFACLLGVGLLAVWLMAAMLRAGRPRLAYLVVPAALLVNPLTYAALYWGHPEELLGAALCAGAVLAAARGRGLAAGLLLGCAVATKQWAALAILPVLIAAPRGTRVRLLGAGAGTAALFIVPMLIADPSRFWLAQRSVGIATTFQHTVTAVNAWFPFAHGSTAATLTPTGTQMTAQYSLPSWLGHVTHPLVILLALGACATYVRRRAGARPEEALQLLALVFLVRCILDPLTYSYHHAPFLVALIAYEGLRRRVPVLSGFAIAAIAAMTYVVAPMKDAGLVNAFYLAWSLPLAAVLTLAIFAPLRLEALVARVRPPAPLVPQDA